MSMIVKNSDRNGEHIIHVNILFLIYVKLLTINYMLLISVFDHSIRMHSVRNKKRPSIYKDDRHLNKSLSFCNLIIDLRHD